jgi:hypothetical protein
MDLERWGELTEVVEAANRAEAERDAGLRELLADALPVPAGEGRPAVASVE